MKSTTDTVPHLGKHVYRSGDTTHPRPLTDDHRIQRFIADEFLPRAVAYVKNPLFLVILTWLVMAALLVAEVMGGK